MQLLAKDGVSATEASLMNTNANKRQAELEDLKTSLELNKEKYHLMYISYESLKRELDINKAKMVSQLEKLKLQNETFKLRDQQLKEPLKADIRGVVSGIDVTEGGSVIPGQRVISIAIPGESRVSLEIPVYQSAFIQKGQNAVVISREADGDKRYKGKVEKVSSAAVKTQYGKGNDKIIAVEVVLIEKNDLKPGFIADVEINGKSKKDIPIVSSFSVLEENKEYFVYINENGRAIKHKIKIGARDINSYEVLDLPVGTEIIVNPFKVRNGEKIKVVD